MNICKLDEMIHSISFLAPGDYAMQKQLFIKQYFPMLYTHLLIMLCCTTLLFSCARPSSGAAPHSLPSPTPVHTSPTPTAQPVLPRTDANDINTETLFRRNLEKVQRILDSLSLDQKLGQLIMVEYLGNSYEGSGLQYMISHEFVGGFMYQESNGNFDGPYATASNVYALSQQTMKDANTPLLIATDQEGGLVNRLYKFHGYLPSAEDIAAIGNPHTALAQGTQQAKWMLQLGINADLAPVVDVHTVDPPVLESRMFGRDPKTVATYAGAFLNGLQKNGVAACLKHFPGLGAVTSDPHNGLPVVQRSMTQLENIDLAPYKLMIQQDQPAMIMSTDVLMPAIDPNLPAELSPKAINGLLRGKLGYNGVVITDGLYMGGISQRWSLSEAAVLSIIAGVDMIEGPYTPSLVADVVTALKEAIQQGRLSMARVDQAVQRILLLKVQYGIIK
jgi:beta-N-acetylhexosaminidase